jgi:DNA-binding PadR family transcriptional regulator
MDKPTLTDAELVILSLICEQPMHGYQIEQHISLRNMAAWTDLSTSSIYYILHRLLEKGFIEKVESPFSTTGIPRKSYQITPQGVAEWKRATIEALSRPRITYTNFLMGLHNLWNIPPEEAATAVDNYRTWLKQDLQRQRDEFDAMEANYFPVDVLFEYGFVLGDAELRFLENLIQELKERARLSKNNPMSPPKLS